MDLKNKTAIVTGGAKGIGYQLVQQLLSEDVRVGVFDIDVSGLKEIEKRHPEISVFECDLTNPARVEQAVSQFFSDAGQIDLLINNAGFLFNSPLVQFAPGGIKKHSIEDWNNVIAINLSSVFYVTVNVAEKMIQKRTKGVIANISSVSASGNRGQSAYSAAKAGVNALTATWSKELGMMGIRVVGIAPGYTDTVSTHQVLTEEVLKEIKRDIPLRRLGTVSEISDGIMAVIKNDYCSGKVFELDGGLVL